MSTQPKGPKDVRFCSLEIPDDGQWLPQSIKANSSATLMFHHLVSVLVVLCCYILTYCLAQTAEVQYSASTLKGLEAASSFIATCRNHDG